MKLVRFPAPPPGLPHDELGDLRFPVPAFTDIQTNEPLAIHRTYLDRSTDNRLERKVLGLGICRLYSELHPVMRLCPDAEIADRLSVGEGIENGLVGILLGYRPVWSCGDARLLSEFPVIEEINHLIIYADRDSAEPNPRVNCKGQRGCNQGGATLGTGGETSAHSQQDGFGDMNDILLRKGETNESERG